ncbi:MAG: ATPase [Proteobacteria bacterium]|nr:ATPase [Pseudomonadota bacterium]
MPSREDLRGTLLRIDGKGYRAYKAIEDSYDFGSFCLVIDHVQGDPFASPSRVRVVVEVTRSGFPAEFYRNKIRSMAFRDYLARAFDKRVRSIVKGKRGIGKSGLISIDRGGQEVLDRTAVVMDGENLEARFIVGLPAAGRTILGQEAIAIFFQEIPRVVEGSFFAESVSISNLRKHVEIIEDQEFLRDHLDDLGVVAFVGNGSILPRRSGVDDRPLEENVVSFMSPPELEIGVDLPNRGRLDGMGIPRGVTLIVGGGFHGKSTLLHAIERGVYCHLPNDGRERVVTHNGAVKIRAEDGRNVERVNIEPFISNLPMGRGTRAFSTENASGSTSQAANILEAVEVGAKVLLLDEDTSATNFMIRDQRMQALVAKDKEPITPFVDKVRTLYEDVGVSTVMVMGGSGDYFDVADTVIMMDTYVPQAVTSQAKEIAREQASHRVTEGGLRFGSVVSRKPLASSFDPRRGKHDRKIDAKGLSSILFGKTVIDLACLEQLVDMSQTRAIGYLIDYYARRYVDNTNNLHDGLRRALGDVEEKGLDILVPYRVGNLAIPRIYELAGAINRLRTLRVHQTSQNS